MATNWNAEMLERFERLEKKVDALDDKVDALDDKVNALDDKVSALDTKVTTLSDELKATEERLTKNVKLETEHMRELVQKAAEGYGATLERIDRNINEMRSEWHAKWTDHDRALTDHARRITVLERPK